MQTSSSQTGSHLVEPLVRRNDRDRDENTGSHSLSEISEPLVATVNLSSTIPLADFTNPNWHISFMTLMDKKLPLSYSAMILPKTISTSRSFEYLKNLWHVDSGATDHIYISRQRFLKYHLINKKEDVWTSAGSVHAISMGTVCLELTKSDGSHSLVKLHNVLHIPSFMTNLISVSLLQKKGIYWCSDDYKLRKMQDQSEVAMCQLMGNLFILSTSDLYEFALLSQSSRVNRPDIQTLHRRLGYLHVDNIMKLISMSTGLEMPDSITKFFCETCVFAKQVKHIAKGPATRALVPGEVIHTDLVGPITPTGYDGSKYGLLLTDDATRATTGVLLKEKSQVKIELPKYTENIQIQHGITIQAFRSDNGREYIDKDLQAWASKKGIKWQFTVPYNPHQNGVSERANCTFEEKLRSMIIDACINKRLWPLGFLWSIQLKNRSLTQAVPDVTPFQALTGKILDLSYLRIFRC